MKPTQPTTTMPSLVLTGHPCIGKTTFAHLLASRALNHSSNTISNVIHIREATSCPDQTKCECYSNSNNEKNTRASLKAEFDRYVMSSNNNNSSSQGGGGSGGSSTLVILDSLNYIKGYRYELYCISKAAGERHGVIWVMGGASDGECVRLDGVSSPSDELAKRRNRDRKELQLKKNDDHTTRILEGITSCEHGNIELDGYYEDDNMMDELVLRYEPPDVKNRWENPLYKVDVTSVLPWGLDGTLDDVDEDVPKGKSAKDESDSMTNQMKAMNVKDDTTSSHSTDAPTLPVKKKSASGFKRRSKKSSTTQQTSSSTQQPKPTRQFEAPMTPSNVPSSMASRNLKESGTTNNAPEQTNNNNGGGGRQKMEDVIDSILDSFLTDIKPLQEGLSTLNQVSAESNVLNLVDSLTHRINNDILKAQQKSPSLTTSGVGGRIVIDNGKRCNRAMSLPKPLYMNELRTFRREFLKWIVGHPLPDGTSEEDMVENYIAYIESNI